MTLIERDGLPLIVQYIASNASSRSASMLPITMKRLATIVVVITTFVSELASRISLSRRSSGQVASSAQTTRILEAPPLG